MSLALQRIDGLLSYLDGDVDPTSEQYTQLFDGTRVPIVALGTWKSSKGVVGKAVSSAIKLGYRHIDCAKAYGNENEVGAAIADALASKAVRRADLYIVSKLWNAHHEPKMVRPMLESTLKDLQVKQLDLYLMHWPMSFSFPIKKVPAKGNKFASADHPVELTFATGEPVSITDTWRAMEECVRAGLTKHIGVSNFNLAQLAEIMGNCTIPPAMLQNESHLFCQGGKMVDFCHKNDIAFTGYSPLGSGDRPWATKEDPRVLDDPVATRLAKKYGKSVAQVLLRFQTQRGIVVPPKSTKEARLKENISLFDFRLTPQEMDELKRQDRNWASCVPPAFPRKHPYWPFNEKLGGLWN